MTSRLLENVYLLDQQLELVACRGVGSGRVACGPGFFKQGTCKYIWFKPFEGKSIEFLVRHLTVQRSLEGALEGALLWQHFREPIMTVAHLLGNGSNWTLGSVFVFLKSARENTYRLRLHQNLNKLPSFKR